MNLSHNFSLEQLTASETSIRRGWPNDPTPEQIANLVDLAATLEEVQRLVGPIHINSAFRSVRLNSYIGGAINSAHLDGYAADIVCPSFGTPLEVCQAIASSGIEYDQVIYEYKSWCHISIAPTMRKMLLSKNYDHPYTEGLA